MSVYGSTYQVYGSKTCSHCRNTHNANFQIQETSQSRFRLMQLMAEMRATVGANWRSFEDKPNRPTMIGLLIAEGFTIVAHSGKLGGREDSAFRSAAKKKDFEVVSRNDLKMPYISLAGRTIPKAEISATKGRRKGFSYPPGSCAAPRLIAKAIRLIQSPNPNPSEWEMSEIFYKGRGSDTGYWVHGLTAHSCDTCENLVPLLLCN